MLHRSRRLFTLVAVLVAANSMAIDSPTTETHTGGFVARMVTDSVMVPATYVAMTSFPVPRVIGGSAASTKDYPWVVKLVGTNCSGALIAPKKVLTAGH